MYSVIRVQAFVRGMIARRELSRLKRMRALEDMPAKRKKEEIHLIEIEEEKKERSLAKKKDLLDTIREQDRMKWSISVDPNRMGERLFGNMARSGSGAVTSIAGGLSTISTGLLQPTKSIPGMEGMPAVPVDDDDEGGEEGRLQSIDDDEDISSYKFSKFVHIAFTGGNAGSHQKKPLKDSLLTHEAEEDKLASMAVFLMLLRFMGDMSEPKYTHDNINNEVAHADPYKSKKDGQRNISILEPNLQPTQSSNSEYSHSIMRSPSFASTSNMSVESSELTMGQVLGDWNDGSLPKSVPITQRIYETFGKGVLRRVTTADVQDASDLKKVKEEKGETEENDDEPIPLEHRVVSQTLKRKTKLMDELSGHLEHAVKQAAQFTNVFNYSKSSAMSTAGPPSTLDDASTIGGGNSRHNSRHLSRNSGMSSAASTIGGSSITGLSSSHHVSNPVASGNNNRDFSSSQLEKWFKIDRPSSNLEKLHFIIGMAILRPKIRDEIYAQICKQLSNNISKSSFARGWIMLSLCCSCFSPTDRFIKYLRNFIQEGPLSYAPFTAGLLKRTVINGARRQPPSASELAACKSKKPIRLIISFMDGTTKTVLADSASTAKEVTGTLCDKIGINDRFGFSLFVALFDKVMSIGNGSEHVMDAISSCEQYAKEMGAQEKYAPWRLFFRKEIFTPWHDAGEDKIATALIYDQVVRGIKFGEYRYNKDDGYADIAAKQWYIDFGSDIQPGKLLRLITHYVPEREIDIDDDDDRTPSYWRDLIIKQHRSSNQVRQNWEPIRVKQEVVHQSRYKWPLLFSRFYEVKYLTSTNGWHFQVFSKKN